jgi:hypothetical protein
MNNFIKILNSDQNKVDPALYAEIPIMQTKENRKQSFIEKGWDQKIPVSVEQLCEAGFYYTGSVDMVQCFYCSGILYGWNNKVDPFIKHNKQFPNCKYLIQKKKLDKLGDREIREYNGNKLIPN